MKRAKVVKNEFPILYKDQMVLATRKRMKTETRRSTGALHKVVNKAPDDYELLPITEQVDGKRVFLFVHKTTGKTVPFASPYGVVGSKLWIREAWRTWAAPIAYGGSKWKDDGSTWTEDANFGIEYRADGEITGLFNADCVPMKAQFKYALEYAHDMETKKEPRWRPSIFMRRPFARMLLDVEAMWCERLQDITEEGALAEGLRIYWRTMEKWGDYGYYKVPGTAATPETALAGFPYLWDSINAKRDIPFDLNPWVLVVKYALPESGEIVVEEVNGEGVLC